MSQPFDAPENARRHRIVSVSAGVSDPSTTSMLAKRISSMAAEAMETVEVEHIELRPLAQAIAGASVSPLRSRELEAALASVRSADALVMATPIYKTSFTGLFKSFIDLLEDDDITATPVILAATGGSARHSLAVDMQLRPLFAYLRADAVATAIFATPEDWGGSDVLDGRIRRAVSELRARLESTTELAQRPKMNDTYRGQEMGRSADDRDEITFDSALMRMATGGSALDL